MDPLSISVSAAAIAKLSIQVSSTIYTFVDDSRNVDTNISDLLQEIVGLSNVLEAIGQSWSQNPTIISAQAQSDGNLWLCVQTSLDDCKGTLEKLDKRLDDIQKNSRFGRGFLRRPTKAIKMNMHMKEIVAYKQRVHWHNSAMQSALQMIHVCLLLNNNSSQETVAQVLAGLRVQIGRVESAVRVKGISAPSGTDLNEDDERLSRNLRDLVRRAERFHSSASTVLDEGTRSTIWGGSIMGDPLNEEQLVDIRNWIPPPTIDEGEAPGYEPPRPIRSPQTTIAEHSITPASDDSDAESDIEGSFTRRLEELAISSLERKEYPKAEAFLKKVVDRSNDGNLDPSRSIATNLVLAFVYGCQAKWAEAESILVPMAMAKKRADSTIFLALQALAMVYLEQKDYVTSVKYCKRAAWGHGRISGKTSAPYFESMALLAHIYNVNGDTTESEVCKSFLPVDFHFDIQEPLGQAQVIFAENIPLQHVFLPGEVQNPTSMISLASSKLAPRQSNPSDMLANPSSKIPMGLPIPASDIALKLSTPEQENVTRLAGLSTREEKYVAKQAGVPTRKWEHVARTSSPSHITSTRNKNGPAVHHGNVNARSSWSQTTDDHASVENINPSSAQGEGAASKLPSENTADGTVSTPNKPPHTAAPLFSTTSIKASPAISKKSYLERVQIVIGIEFGSSSTSVAYAFIGRTFRPDRLEAREELMMIWRAHGNTNIQIPNVLYYDEETKVIGWGFDSAIALSPTGYPKPGIQKVEHFKQHLMLGDTQVSDVVSLHPLPSGKSATDVVNDFLRMVREGVVAQLRNAFGDAVTNDPGSILYYFTKPHSWNSQIETRLYEAILRAGYIEDVDDDHCRLISDAEAIVQFSLKSGLFNLQTNDVVLVADCGSSTCEVVAFACRHESPVSIEDYTLPARDSCGSTALNRNFSNVLRERIKLMHLPQDSKTSGRVYAKCFMDFDKRIKNDFKNNGKRWAVDVGIETDFPDAGIEEGYIIFTNEEVLSCFQPVINRILKMIDLQISDITTKAESSGSYLQNILVAGTLATSDYLFATIKHHVPTHLWNKVVRPKDSASAKAKGAVAAGLLSLSRGASHDMAPPRSTTSDNHLSVTSQLAYNHDLSSPRVTLNQSTFSGDVWIAPLTWVIRKPVPFRSHHSRYYPETRRLLDGEDWCVNNAHIILQKDQRLGVKGRLTESSIKINMVKFVYPGDPLELVDQIYSTTNESLSNVAWAYDKDRYARDNLQAGWYMSVGDHELGLRLVATVATDLSDKNPDLHFRKFRNIDKAYYLVEYDIEVGFWEYGVPPEVGLNWVKSWFAGKEVSYQALR